MPSPNFPELEERVLAFWKADDTFNASVQRNPAGENGENEFVFYDGPPFANGLPHYGHLLTGYVKDIVPRYQTMRGRHVERRFGWDCHGLPAELETMSQLGLKTKADIEELGIEKFNDACRKSVLRYTQEWQDYVTRQARWVDFDHDYKTLEPDYMESVLWAFKSLYDKGLVYSGLRVLPYCWSDETPLSNHELRMDDEVYQSRQDPAVTVGPAVGDRRTGVDLDHHAVDAAEQPGDHGPARHRVRGGRVGLHRHHRAVRDRRGAGRVVRARALRGSEGGLEQSGGGAADRRRPARPLVHAAVLLLPGASQRAPGAGGRLRHHRGRHRPGAQRRRLR